MDKERIQNAVREILIAVGEDPDREGLLETPKRVANMYEEIFAGLTEDPKQHIKLFNEQSNDEMVIVKDIPFYSMCEHHLLPFFGKAHIGYIPSDNKIIGLSKLEELLIILQKSRRCRKGSQAILQIFLMIIFSLKVLP